MTYMNPQTILTQFVLLLSCLFSPMNEAKGTPIANRLYFENYDLNYGLSTENIRRIHKDKKGILWFATDNGLIRYDGYEFKTYRNDLNNPELLGDNNIITISDDDERLWIGTPKGLDYMDKSDRTFHNFNDNRISGVNTSVCIGNELWVGTYKGLYVINHDDDGFRVREITIDKNLKAPNVRSLLYDSKGRLWIGADKLGLCRYDLDSGKTIRYSEGHCRNYAHVLHEDSEGNIWIGSWGGGLTLMEKSYDPRAAVYTIFRKGNGNQSLLSDYVYSICQDKVSHEMWIGTSSGLNVLYETRKGWEKKEYLYDGSTSGPSDNSISDLYQDENGTMWIATFGGGIDKVSLIKNNIIQDPLEQLKKTHHTNNITCMYRTPEGKMILGLNHSGLVYYDPSDGDFENIADLPGMSILPEKGMFRSILELDHGRRILVSCEEKGLYLIRMNQGQPTQAKLFNVSNSGFLSENYGFKLLEDSLDRIWIANGNNISIVDQDFNLIHHNILQKNIADNITYLHESIGEIWVGTKKSGIIRVTENPAGNLQFSCFKTQNEKMTSNTILCIHTDSNGKIWVGTQGGGILQFDRKEDRFTNKNKDLKIPYSDILDIFEDNTGNLWACAQDAMMKIGQHPDSRTEIYESFSFPWKNIINSECNLIHIGDSLIAFGGNNGICYMNPEKMMMNNTNAPIFFSDIMVNYHSIFESSADKGYHFKDQSLVLDCHNNNFAVNFTALGYDTKKKEQYAYRLLGYENEWHYIDNQHRLANYINLKKGKYTFQVKSSASNEGWEILPEELYIRVKPHPLDTWYAYIVYLLLICISIYYTYKISKNKLELKKAFVEAKIEKEKNEELTKSKLRFFTNISHEFLTPLTIIGCSTDAIEPNDRNQANNLDTIKKNVNRLRNLIRQVLDFNKLENKKMELKVADGNLSEMIISICENDFQSLASQRNIALKCDIPATVHGWFDADKIDKIVTNLLSNAFKYNYDNSFVKVSLHEDYDENKRYAILEIQDGGMGMSPEDLNNLYERFFENDYRTSRKEGTGIGMALTKALTELHKGKIEVSSTVGKGTNFKITFPINENSYSIEERAEESSSDMSSDGLSASPAISNGERLLIVEDNEELRNVMQQYLSKYYVVNTACNGAEALKMLNDSTYNIMVTDIMMPIMDGIELCKMVKENIETSDIPVIVLTAKTSDKDKIIAYDCGADAFISKPFPMALLVSRINNLTKGRKQMIKNYADGKNNVQLKDITYTSIDEKFIENAVRIVEENISNENFDLEDFTDEMNVSKSTLYRKIKSLTGMSTNEFIKDIRLKYACRYMKEKEVNISEIAYLVGFDQPKYFTYCFKKKFGILPSEYMARQHPKK